MHSLSLLSQCKKCHLCSCSKSNLICLLGRGTSTSLTLVPLRDKSPPESSCGPVHRPWWSPSLCYMPFLVTWPPQDAHACRVPLTDHEQSLKLHCCFQCTELSCTRHPTGLLPPDTVSQSRAHSGHVLTTSVVGGRSPSC